jgi:hypothetical protein
LLLLLSIIMSNNYHRRSQYAAGKNGGADDDDVNALLPAEVTQAMYVAADRVRDIFEYYGMQVSDHA